MLRQARGELNLDLANGWLIGARLTDMEAALAAGVLPILVRTGHGAGQEPAVRKLFPALRIVDDLAQAATQIRQLRKPGGPPT